MPFIHNQLLFTLYLSDPRTMPRKRNNNFPIGTYAKKKRAVLEELCEEKVHALSEVKIQQQKIRRLKEKGHVLRQTAENTNTGIQTPPSTKRQLRVLTPTSLENPMITPRESRRRRVNTIEAAAKIHGATKSNIKPALDGLFDTLQGKCKTSELGDYVLKDEELAGYIVKQIQKKEKHTFHNSARNILRSIAAYYSAGVMGKRKYQAVRLATSMTCSKRKRGGRTSIKYMGSLDIPKLLTYNTLVKEINAIDIGNVQSVQVFALDNEDSTTRGCFRDLREYLPRLAKHYLSGTDNLKWFGETEGTFKVAFGGDGCPFGKFETACSFLVSFLNTGKKVASSSDNFLVFGANCEETSSLVKKYVLSIYKQISDIEGTLYEIDGFHVSFQFAELPNDMKMLAMLAGELSNAATYFSSFANVSSADSGNLQGRFGTDEECKWKPWSYNQRNEVASKVKALKAKLENQTLCQQTKRSKVTDFISKQKSRQEFQPMLGKFIDKAHVEPLHLKNNAWQYFFRSVLKEALGKTCLLPSHKTFEEIPPDSCFARVINALQHEVKTKRLAKRVRQWYNETQGKKGDLQYRFTGKESRLFCHNFMRLLKYLSSEEDTPKQKQTVLALVYIGIRLRDCCSIFNRLDINEQDIAKLEVAAIEYCHANKLFLPYTINPTIWTLGHVLPVHARDVFSKYQQGLLTVTMEGREAKHIALQRLSHNTTYQSRWQEIFRHEFIMLVWLPEQGHQPCSYTESKDVYIPERVNDPAYCYCGLLKASPANTHCCFCGDKLMTLIHESVVNKKYSPGLSM
ncbi:uncharacterized protein LOC116606566 isoform X1 [Nematostella vectensis]|uniref:uncharacterized protein LOC116606566 isoform X1 n=2 Tax=Nematostella vectensis TaxID=45351 RepID=UPI0020776850|nr:uncharacterized protein LOC116606566 isoform X1 [Nematostella vectensis]